MYIESVANRNSPPCILLRESSRQGGKVRKRSLANLTHWPDELAELISAWDNLTNNVHSAIAALAIIGR